MLKIGHAVTRPGRKPSDGPVTINVPEELETVPGIIQDQSDVDFYTREYPLENPATDWTAVQEWRWTQFTKDTREAYAIYQKLGVGHVRAANKSGDLCPSVRPVPSKDVSQEIKAKARDLGFGEVGITKFDRRYVYEGYKSWVKFPHAICLAFEQDYEATHCIPSLEAEGSHHSTYRIMQEMALAFADYIRSLGYHAQVHSPLANKVVVIPMFVEAGLGQLGANGQLLSPHFGSRARLMLITTDALVTYDQPVDYGINAFCNICQVCVNRCPGRALIRDKVWLRGVKKNKVIYKRCQPVMERYNDCGICMKVCPIQRYGMKPVMEHYIATGHVLGKGTNLLEGYELQGMGYFGPGELPSFDTEFFRMPHGKSEDVAFEEFKGKVKAGELTDGAQRDVLLREFKKTVEKYLTTPIKRMYEDSDVEEV